MNIAQASSVGQTALSVLRFIGAPLRMLFSMVGGKVITAAMGSLSKSTVSNSSRRASIPRLSCPWAR